MIDASAVVDVLANDRPVAALLQRVSWQPWYAPHLIDLEVLNSLRRLVFRKQITAEFAASVRVDFSLITISRYPHSGFRERIWELRDSMSAYDASYVALAEALEVPLITTDARLGRAPGSRCAVEVFGLSED